jgi:hypothetical protein
MSDPMNVQQAIQRLEASVPATGPSVGQMLQAVIERGVTAENVAAMDKLVGLYERMQDKDAEKQFAAAFVALQSEMPAIRAIRAVPDKQGGVKYRYAPYEDIMEQVRPLVLKHGFSITFTTEYGENRVIQHCTLQHVGGHKRTNSFAARIGSGPPNASQAQADGAASTYAKRFALCDALNIVTESDTDARAEGDTISAEQADELFRRVHETNSNEAAFLKFCGVTPSGERITMEDYRKIRSAKYDAADEMLARKEGGR